MSFAKFLAMPATRSPSRSPRMPSTSSYSKDKAAKPNTRELITIKTESKESDDSPSGKMASDSSKSKTNTSGARDGKPAEKTEKTPYRKPSELPPSKGSGNWNSSANRNKERKFSGRCRLFVGNLVSCEETELQEMFEKYGEVAETFVNKEKGFGFVRLVSICSIIVVELSPRPLNEKGTRKYGSYLVGR